MDSDHEQARRDLIADLSHDLRAPLVAMRGCLELLVLRGASLSGEERRHYAEIALRQSERLASLVDELFELSTLDFKGAAIERESFALGELASDVMQKFAVGAAQRRIGLGVEVAAGVPAVEADLRLIERVFDNLIVNALRHTPDGGTVEIRVALASQGVRVEVADTGSGIPAAELPFVFDRHFRGAAARRDDPRGNGLGLTIARRIVELHGGVLRAESEPMRGTRFLFELPVRA